MKESRNARKPSHCRDSHLALGGRIWSLPLLVMCLWSGQRKAGLTPIFELQEGFWLYGKAIFYESRFQGNTLSSNLQLESNLVQKTTSMLTYPYIISRNSVSPARLVNSQPSLRAMLCFEVFNYVPSKLLLVLPLHQL